jgi:hypothetical protein
MDAALTSRGNEALLEPPGGAVLTTEATEVDIDDWISS